MGSITCSKAYFRGTRTCSRAYFRRWRASSGWSARISVTAHACISCVLCGSACHARAHVIFIDTLLCFRDTLLCFLDSLLYLLDNLLCFLDTLLCFLDTLVWMVRAHFRDGPRVHQLRVVRQRLDLGLRDYELDYP